MSDPKEGKTYIVECPFVRDTFSSCDEDGPFTVPTWRPGVDWEMCAPDNSEAVADGVGKVSYKVVSVHKLPHPYHTRIFFVRQWIDPDGKVFGKKNLMIMGVNAFKRRLAGYRFGGYEDGFRIRQDLSQPTKEA